MLCTFIIICTAAQTIFLTSRVHTLPKLISCRHSSKLVHLPPPSLTHGSTFTFTSGFPSLNRFLLFHFPSPATFFCPSEAKEKTYSFCSANFEVFNLFNWYYKRDAFAPNVYRHPLNCPRCSTTSQSSSSSSLPGFRCP